MIGQPRPTKIFVKGVRPLFRSGLAALWVASGFVLPAQAATEATLVGSAHFDVSVDRGLLSLEARDAALSHILREVAEQADFNLSFRGAVNTPVTLSLDGVPLEKGIRRLVGRNSLVILHQSREVRSVLVDVAYNAPVVALQADVPAYRLDRIYGDVTRPDRLGRLRAIRHLGRRGDAPAVKDLGLVLALEQDPVLRRMAVIGLGTAGGDQAVAVMVQALRDEDPSVRTQTLRALGQSKSATARTAVVGALDDEAAMVRAQAIRVLGELGGEEAVEALRDVLLDESDPSIRREAVGALAKLPGEEAAFALEIGAADPDVSVREAALVAIEGRS